MEWEARLWEGRPGIRQRASLVALVAAAAGYILFRGETFHPNVAPFMALLGAGVVLASTAELFLPLKFSLGENEARRRCGLSVSAIRWSDVKRLIPEQGGIRLSPLEKPGRLDAFRGVQLVYASNEAQVLAKIRELWKADGDVLGTRPYAGGDGPLDREGGE